MRAVVRHDYGGPESLQLAEAAVPTPTAGQVLIEVRAAGLDRGAWHLMAGLPYLTRLMFGLRRPRQPILGMEVAGTVAAVGDGVSRFAVGDDVFGTADGSFAEFAVADAAKLALKPASVDVEGAAVVAVSGLTALQAVQDVGEVQAGQRVLVIGASGGVGSFAVQIAAHAGAAVTGVASGAKADFVRSLGATDVIDYTSTDITATTDRFDLIIDTNGRRKVRLLQRILTPTGTLVIVGGEDGGKLTGGIQRQLGAPIRSLSTRRRLTFFISTANPARMEQLAHLLEDGVITPAVGARYSLGEARRAMTDLLAGRIAGKAVIRIPDAA
ncbi:zinc-binding dehydrogenase [Agromyces bracchium]|uniref:Zinc-binding dehydrogenase n=1 Tax=Agromyces bracchium TaxID=88376 RepID=A0A6I3LWH2_9MICO|nr:zinc-binding dehydrogenase [Agromyces bracchium]